MPLASLHTFYDAIGPLQMDDNQRITVEAHIFVGAFMSNAMMNIMAANNEFGGYRNKFSGRK